MKTVYDVLIKQHSEDIQMYANVLTSGGAKDYAHYRELVGKLEGLGRAIENCKELKNRQGEEELDD